MGRLNQSGVGKRAEECRIRFLFGARVVLEIVGFMIWRKFVASVLMILVSEIAELKQLF